MGKGNFAVAQSGGPTAAINATLLGVIEGAMESGCTIFGAVNGIRGVIDNNFMNPISVEEIASRLETLEDVV